MIPRTVRRKNRGWSALRYLGLLLLLLLLPACPAQAPAPLRIGTNPWLGYEPLYLAKDLGFFKTGMVQPLRFASASATIAALSEKKLEAAALTLDEVLSVSQFEPDLAIVLVVDVSNGGDALLAKPEISQPAELKGRWLGVESSAVGAYMLQRFLEKSGLTEKELQVVNLPIDAHEAAYSAGKIEAVITFEPVRTRLLARGARVLFDSSEIPGEIIDVLVVRASYLREHPKVVEQLLVGWFKALAQIRDQPAGAAEKMRGALGFSSEEVLKAYSGLRLPDRRENRTLLLGAPPPLQKTAEKLQEVMLRLRLLYKKSNMEQLLDQVELARLYQP